MERIKQALELARAQRPHDKGGSGDGSTTRGVQPDKEANTIQYTQTRTFTPDLKVMRDNRVLMGDGEDQATRAVKMLRTQVLQRMVGNGWNALAVTSPGPGQGKTLTTVNLAISLAREVNYSVLLVDLDLHNPSVHRYFGYEPDVGLDDFLREDVGLSKVLFNPGMQHLVVLPVSTPVANSSELLSSPQMHALVEEMKARYPSRFVLFDLPPVLSVDDALSFTPYVDAVLLVLEEGVTTRDDVARSVDLLRNTAFLGTVLNKSSAQITGAY